MKHTDELIRQSTLEVLRDFGHRYLEAFPDADLDEVLVYPSWVMGQFERANPKILASAGGVLCELYSQSVHFALYNREPEDIDLVQRAMPSFAAALVSDEAAQDYLAETITAMDVELKWFDMVRELGPQRETLHELGEGFPGLQRYVDLVNKDDDIRVERIVEVEDEGRPYYLAIVTIGGMGIVWNTFFGNEFMHMGPSIRPYTCWEYIDSDDVSEKNLKVDDEGKVSRYIHDKSPGFNNARSVLHSELRAEYEELFGGRDAFEDPELLGAMMVDLLNRALDGQCLGQYSSGGIHGSNLYYQEVAAILGVSEATMSSVAFAMQSQKKLSLNGAVLCRYHPNRERLDLDPSHLMTRVSVLGSDGNVDPDIEIDVFDPKNANERDEFRIVKRKVSTGEVIETRSVRLFHESMFGYDVEDLANRDRVIEELGGHAAIPFERDSGSLTR